MRTRFSIRSLRKGAAFLLCLCMVFLLAGCTLNQTDKAQITDMLIKSTADIQSVETAITFHMEGQYYEGDENGEVNPLEQPHKAAIGSEIVIKASFEPLAFYSESFSNITVDGFTTPEVRYGYIVQSDSRYIDYEAVGEQEVWEKSFISRPDELSLQKRTGLIVDWEDFMSMLDYETTHDNGDGTSALVYEGRIYSTILQEIFTNRIFDDFIYNVERLINETVPCTFYIDSETYLPINFELDMTEEFITHDVTFTDAKVTVSYSEWNELDPIMVPKKVSVLAEDHSAAQYSSFAARDLFTPYEPVVDPNAGTEDDNLPKPANSLPVWAQEAGLTTGEGGTADWYNTVSVLMLKKSAELVSPLVLPNEASITLDLNNCVLTAPVGQSAITVKEGAVVSLVVMDTSNIKNGMLYGHDGKQPGEAGTSAIDFTKANEASSIEIMGGAKIYGGNGMDNGAASAGAGGTAIAGGYSKVTITPESPTVSPTVQGGDGGLYTGTSRTAGVSGNGGSAISTLAPNTKDSTKVIIGGGYVRGGFSGNGVEAPAVSTPKSK